MKIAEQQIELVKPSSVADCYDVLTAIGANAIRGQAAALGVCARGDGRPVVRLKSKSAADWLAYGGAVVDYYAAKGLGVADWIEAAQGALDLISEAVAGTSSGEGKEAEGN